MSIHVPPDWWKSMFDEVYLETDARSVCNTEITRREIDLVFDLLPIRRGQKILDLCGGHGRHSFELCSRGYTECTLLDYSPVLTDRAKSRAAECRYPVNVKCGDARNSRLPPDHFDHVLIMGNSLGYMLSADADAKILSEAYRVIRPGGWLLVDVVDGTTIKKTFNPLSWHETDNDLVVCRQRELQGDILAARELVIHKKTGQVRDKTYALNLYDAKSLSQLFRQSGFNRVQVKTDFSPQQTAGDYGFMNCRMIVIGQKPEPSI